MDSFGFLSSSNKDTDKNKFTFLSKVDLSHLHADCYSSCVFLGPEGFQSPGPHLSLCSWCAAGCRACGGSQAKFPGTSARLTWMLDDNTDPYLRIVKPESQEAGVGESGLFTIMHIQPGPSDQLSETTE